eukprot:418381_1
MQHTDWEIIGFIISAYCGCLVIPLFLCDALRNMLNNKTIRNRMKYPAIISLSAGLLFCILVGFVRSTFLFKTLDFGYHTLTCQMSYGMSYVFYAISKWSMYILFVNRIEIVLGSSDYAMSEKFLNNMRYIMTTVCVIVCITAFLTDKQQIITPIFHISLCTLTHSSVFLISLLGLMDIALPIWLLWLYLSKLYKLSKRLESGFEHDDNKIQMMKQMESQFIKSTILVAVAVLSSLCFLFIGNLVWWSIGWFIPLDSIINALSVYLMYSFSQPTYLCCCRPCIGCCKIFFGLSQRNVPESREVTG